MAEDGVAVVESERGVDPLDLPHLPSLFRGSAEYSIDDKNRVTLPVWLRKPLARAGGNLATLDGIAVIWTEEVFREVVDLLAAAVAQGIDNGGIDKKQQRLFMSQVFHVQPDTQGRIQIPERIRVEAGLEREVVVCGVGTRIEIWPASRWVLEEALDQDSSVALLIDGAGL